MAYGFLLIDGVTVAAPDKMLGRGSELNTNVAQFGDGYAQRSPRGINNIKSTFNIAFVNRSELEIDDITEFFDSKNGGHFDFTYPYKGGEVTVQVVCESYNVTFISDAIYSCTSTFKKVYTL